MKDILFYDSTCPLCAHEIGKLKRSCDANIQFKDIHSLSDQDIALLKAPTPSRDDMFQRLHCLTHDQGWLIGAKANLRAWQHTPFKTWIKPLYWPVVSQAVEGLYELWLIYYHFQRQRRLNCHACERKK